MAFELITGPPGSGKTSLLLEEALGVAARGGRVWWVGLPSQRSWFYRRATRAGAVLGLEFQTLQQVYYRLLAHARRLQPLLVATGRLALVGQALHELRGAPPAPGEAKLFASALAEAKRYGLGPSAVAGADPESERLREVFERYEAIKGPAWDYDDFRLQALRLAEAGEAVPEADLVVVDGFRELGPLDLRLLVCLGAAHEVRLALPEAPAHLRPQRRTTLERPPAPRVYAAPNPVAEARWVMRALKRDLAGGTDPLDLAVILPEGDIDAFAALADEYRVPVMDERPVALAHTAPGRMLVDLLELADYPTASRLLPVGELSGLAAAALEGKVAGEEAMTALARDLGVEAEFSRWLERLREDADPLAWAQGLVEFVLGASQTAAAEAGTHGSTLTPEEFSELALERAKEAAKVATGAGFRAWWAALLAETSLARNRPGGVALLTERLASGRRFERVYLVRANEGAYGSGEREDYFIAEDLRVPAAQLAAGGDEGEAFTRLPRRFGSRDRLLFADLRSRGEEVIITYPLADRSSPLLPEPELLGGEEAQALPALPAASRLELSAAQPYSAPVGEQRLGDPLRIPLESLRDYADCGMRWWLQSLLAGEAGSVPWWEEFRSALLEAGELGPQARAELAARFPAAAAWLEEHAERLAGLRLGVRLPADGDYPEVIVHAARREGSEGVIYIFTEPSDAITPERAQEVFNNRWTERLACRDLLSNYRGRYERLSVVVWPILGEPVTAVPDIHYVWRGMNRDARAAARAAERFRQGTVTANPGFRCASCPVRDACREAAL